MFPAELFMWTLWLTESSGSTHFLHVWEPHEQNHFARSTALMLLIWDKLDLLGQNGRSLGGYIGETMTTVNIVNQDGVEQ